MRWFRIRLVETDFPSTVTGPDGVPLAPPRIRVPASAGSPFAVPFAYTLHAARGAASLDGLLGVRSATFEAPFDWTALDLDAAKRVYRDILGVEPLAGQVF